MAYSVLEEIEKAGKTLTVADVARILGVSDKTIYETVARGELPKIKGISGAIRVDPDTLIAHLRRHNPEMLEQPVVRKPAPAHKRKAASPRKVAA